MDLFFGNGCLFFGGAFEALERQLIQPVENHSGGE
jgi:hypothetical protein